MKPEPNRVPVPIMKLTGKPFLFVLGWLLLGLVQAAATRLSSDEGYYWFYSTRLQWGYYDHPPMVALMIKAGYSLFQNELGVRLLNLLVGSASFLLLFRLVPPQLRQKNSTWLVLLAQPLLHYFSIIVFPDGPLLFFSLLFLTGYKRGLEKKDALSALLLGLSMAGMFYSKYHGALVVLFTVLSNPRLLKAKWFWLSLPIPLALAVPHVWWQYRHGFPSLQYHLSGRMSGFSFQYVGEYISQQVPATGLVFLVALLALRVQEQFEKTLKFIAIGTLLFFLFSSLAGFVHFHWTSVALFPMALLAIRYFAEPRRRRLFYWLAVPFFIAILFFRIHVLYPVLPFLEKGTDHYRNRDRWAQQVARLAGQGPVLFVQDFREAGLYTFYTNRLAVALFGGDKRKTQYDLWGYEDSLQGKNVLMIQRREFPGCSRLYSQMGKTVFYRPAPGFESYYNISVKGQMARPVRDSLRLQVQVFNHRKTPLLFPPGLSAQPPVLFYQVKNDRGVQVMFDTLKYFTAPDQLAPGATAVFNFSVSRPPLPPGNYSLAIGFMQDLLPLSFNSVKNHFRLAAE